MPIQFMYQQNIFFSMCCNFMERGALWLIAHCDTDKGNKQGYTHSKVHSKVNFAGWLLSCAITSSNVEDYATIPLI